MKEIVNNVFDKSVTFIKQIKKNSKTHATTRASSLKQVKCYSKNRAARAAAKTTIEIS